LLGDIVCRRPPVKTVVTAKKPFGKAKYSPVKHARYLDWEDAFDVEFEDGLSFLELHATIKKANKISAVIKVKLRREAGTECGQRGSFN
jgi:hypothetical protein